MDRLSTFDIVNVLYNLLSSHPTLKTSITGNIYKKRPLNSKQEDIVIGSLPVSNDQIQQTVANINIHVPNLSVKLSNLQDNTQPDLKRLNELTTLVWGIVDEKYYNDYWFFVQQQNLFEDEGNQHYANIRVNFNSLKTSN